MHMPPAGSGAPYKNGSRYWGDFTRYADVGGKREALKLPSHAYATDDFQIAQKLYTERVSYYEQLRLRWVFTGHGADVPPLEFASRYLEHAALNDAMSYENLAKAQHALEVMLTLPCVADIQTVAAFNRQHVTAVVRALQNRPTKRGHPPAPATVRRYLMALSGMLRRAKFEGLLAVNPCEDHDDIPNPEPTKRVDFLEITEGRDLLLQVRRSGKSPWAPDQARFLLYTGCRKAEMNGTMVEDIDFTGHRVLVHRYDHRGLKTKAASREIPLWPDLETWIGESLERFPRPRGTLLFPRLHAVPKEGEPLRVVSIELAGGMMQRIRGALQGAAKRAGIAKVIGHHTLRHTYVSSRLQMVEAGRVPGTLVPIDRFALARELGHEGPTVIERIYGHVQAGRCRTTVLSYFNMAS